MCNIFLRDLTNQLTLLNKWKISNSHLNFIKYDDNNNYSSLDDLSLSLYSLLQVIATKDINSDDAFTLEKVCIQMNHSMHVILM